jgi:glutamate-5-semialdehyde dehydrogenase
MVDATSTINLVEIGKRVKAASIQLARLTTEEKSTALRTIADALEDNREQLLAVNALDIADAEAAGMDPLYIRDRLNLARRMDGMIADVRKVADLPDPVGQEFDHAVLENGLKVHKRRTPLGVLGVIYEARPQVTVDVASLALKTGNAVILRGGSEVLRTNQALVDVLSETLASVGIPGDAIAFINSPDRKLVGEMLKLHQYVDIIIPRGGNSLHTFCRENSSIPVITGGIGICHLYVDPTARLDDALAIVHNAKTQSPAVCNALDTLLVHRQVAGQFLLQVVDHLSKDGVTFKADPDALSSLDGKAGVDAAGPDDFDTEWYALTLGLKVVDSLEEAIQHIRVHSTQHSDGILTQNMDDADYFLNEIDSAAVYVNASTRFTDGSALGLGAEIAVSTQKLHARGPMALAELTTYKWIILGDGHVRA